MKNLFRLLAITVVLAVAIPASAAKTPKELTVYLRQDNDGGTGCAAPYLSVEDGPDSGNGCTYIFQAAQEALIAAGQPPLEWVWSGSLPAPAKLSSGQLKASFLVRHGGSANGTLKVVVNAQVGTKSTEVGSFTTPAFANAPSTAGGGIPVEFELDIPSKLKGKKITGFMLVTTFHGVSNAPYIDLENPSFFTVPVK